MSVSDSRRPIELLSTDLIRNILDWLNDDPADPVRFSLTSKGYYFLLHQIVEPLRIAIAHQTDPNRGSGNTNGSRPSRVRQCLGERAWFVSTPDGELVRAANTLAYGTKYMFFQYTGNGEGRERMHLGRHIQVGPKRFGLALLRSDELIQYWTIHANEETNSNGIYRGTSMTCMLSVVGGRSEAFDREDPDGPETGFLQCINGDPDRQDERVAWYVQHVRLQSDIAKATAGRFEITVLSKEAWQAQILLKQEFQMGFPVMVYPKAVFNRGGTACLYDPNTVMHHGTGGFPPMAVTVRLHIWIENSHCCLNAPTLPFKIAVPILQDDGVGSDETFCDARHFISSLYLRRSARIDYLVYYVAVAADAQERVNRNRRGWFGGATSSLNDMRRQRLTHREHSQREKVDEFGNHWFILYIPGATLEPSVPEQPLRAEHDYWYATLGP